MTITLLDVVAQMHNFDTPKPNELSELPDMGIFRQFRHILGEVFGVKGNNLE